MVSPEVVGHTIFGCFGEPDFGAHGTEIGTGLQNTLDIVDGCPTAGIAARVCYDLMLNGYDDWFLPSKDELHLLYTDLVMPGRYDFGFYLYHSSSAGGSSTSWQEYVYEGVQSLFDTVAGGYVRAVREF